MSGEVLAARGEVVSVRQRSNGARAQITPALGRIAPRSRILVNSCGGACLAVPLGMMKLASLAVIAALSGCLSFEPPASNVDLSVEIREDGLFQVENKETRAAIYDANGARLAQIQTEAATDGVEEYIAPSSLEGASACVTVQQWYEVIACAGCPTTRECYDVIPRMCQPIVLEHGSWFEMTVEEPEADLVVSFSLALHLVESP